MTSGSGDRYVLVGLRSGWVVEPLGNDARDYPALADPDGVVPDHLEEAALYTSIGLVVE